MAKTTKSKRMTIPGVLQERSTQVKIVLQGKVESFYDYEKRLNKILLDLPRNTFVFPSASADGRLCSIINYKSDK